jgi:lactate dehydrogenase-like 2-hydroxyacid dehydrogenase
MSALVPLLVLNSHSKVHLARLSRHYDVIYAPTPAERKAAVQAQAGRIRAVLTIGTIGLNAAEIAAMPALEVICTMGVGYENVDLAAARARGIVLANGAGTNADCVADHAFGLLIAAVRGILKLDRLCREGVWRDAIGAPPNVSGKRLGILGLGTIGQKIARRGAGFDMEIGYHNRKPRADVAHRYFADVLALADWCDFLVIATPGGAGTRHLVDRAVLDALGPQGFVVNIARGSLIDTEALAAALREGRLGGAGIDVYESEPRPPAPLVGLDGVVLTPHLAGWSPESMEASLQRVLDNLAGHFSGRGVASPI